MTTQHGGSSESPAQAGAFDSHHPPSPELISDCVHCGFCLPACPTYELTGEEMNSPRGRIYQMKLISEGEAPLDAAAVSHFDNCLGCMACVTACPSGVRYDQLIESVRPQIERNWARSRGDRAFRELIFRLFPYPRRLRWAAVLGAVYQRLGIRRVLSRTGLLRRLPARLRALEALMPDVPLRAALRRTPVRSKALGLAGTETPPDPSSDTRPEPDSPATSAPAGEPPMAEPSMGEPAEGAPVAPAAAARRTVGMVTGCVQQVFFAQVNEATVRVLTAEGCDVIAPAEQGCCGALSEHAGREEEAAGRARRLIDVFEPLDVDTIVVNVAGCGSALKEYGRLLADDPRYRERAEAFAAKVRDISELLAELPPSAPRHPVPARLAHHEACHLAHAQGVREQPRAVLRAIPELDVVDIPEADMCCGSAGVYNLIQPEPAEELGRRKAGNVRSTAPDAVVTANPGCLLQISRHLDKQLPVLHPVQVVDASIRGVRPW
ncbi:(Fe-S)-binding protein [Streptomyces marispadix]|uniref:4Fe-4S dicluster domain-containing protein n=1 Tax=Streptomyces marispadix TaxID=2922868 RepID=A0ABS9SSG0_9ACTN|nr:heterodisulfide reductase-related iron-sulfur binding cluster [Streptomyces marispadix]MCH6159133.1 4Fe-4S dicluster domain-containing protein [Streptomyces marispadix]